MRNREKTENNILKAAQTIITFDGFNALRINHLAELSKCDKVLIYRYFNTIEGVLSALAQKVPMLPVAQDFMSSLSLDGENISLRASQLATCFGQLLVKSPLVFRLEHAHQLEDNALTKSYHEEKEHFLKGMQEALVEPSRERAALIGLCWAAAAENPERPTRSLKAFDEQLPLLTFYTHVLEEVSQKQEELVADDLPTNLL